jgi:hypothetical protein
VGVRLSLAVDTLLGPEGTSTVVFVSFGAFLILVRDCPLGGGVAGGGVGVGRCLRIAQWTRASLWSSCRGRTVDALAPGADEGRGRPR